MKRKIFITIFLSVLMISLFSCKKDTLTTLEKSKMVAPTLISPTFSNLVMSKENEDDNITFEWTPAEYGLNLSISYTIEVDFQGNNFTDAISVGTSDTTIFQISKKSLNSTLTLNGFPELGESNAEFRVKSVVSNNVDDLSSDVLEVKVTTYAGDVPPLYILGDATPPGWNNLNALEMTYIGDGDYQIEIALLSGNYWKLIAVLGNWAPQWGQNSGDWTAGTLSYRPTENDPDPSAIPSPDSDGTYIVTANTRDLTYSVVAAK